MFNLYFRCCLFLTNLCQTRAGTHKHTHFCKLVHVMQVLHPPFCHQLKAQQILQMQSFFFFFLVTQWTAKWHHRRPHTVARSVEIHGFDIKGHAAREQEREKTETDLTSVLLCSTMTCIFGTIWSFLEFPTTVMARMSSWGGVIDSKSSCFRPLALPVDQWLQS